MFEEIRKNASVAIRELVETAGLEAGDLLVVGCSSSEIVGGKIGKNSSLEAAEAVFEEIYPFLKEKGSEIDTNMIEARDFEIAAGKGNINE